MAGAHFVVGWALWSLVFTPPLPPRVKPLWVALVTSEATRPEPEQPPPTPPLLPPPLPPLPPRATPLPLPENLSIAAPGPAPAAPPPVAQAVASPNPAVANPVAAPAATPAPPRPAPPPPPPLPRLLRADQVRYLVMPPAEVPLLSRRAGEHGVVWLRVRIDAEGRPVRISLHRSSGFQRLDEQALAAMSKARFAPQLEGGAPVEVEVIAPIDYPAD